MTSAVVEMHWNILFRVVIGHHVPVLWSGHRVTVPMVTCSSCHHRELTMEAPLDLFHQEMLMSHCGVRNPRGCMCRVSLSESLHRRTPAHSVIWHPHFHVQLVCRVLAQATSPRKAESRRSLQTRDVWSSLNMTGTLCRAQKSKWYSTRSTIMIY